MQLTQFIDGLTKNPDFKAFDTKMKSINVNLLERKPVDLDEFIFSKDYCALEKVSPKQAQLLLALDNMDASIKSPIEFIVVAGKGGGKDLISSIANLRFCYRLSLEGPPKDFTGLSLGLPITVLNIAVNADQANNVYFETFKSIGKNIFKRLGCDVKAGEVIFPGNITAVSGHSEAEGMEGYNLFACVLDEIAAFKTEGELKGKSFRSKQSAPYLYNMAKSSIRSRFPKTGKLILISFPRFADDFILQKYNEGQGREEVYTEFAKTWEFNPFAHEEDFEAEKEQDVKEYLSKYCCLSGDNFIFTNKGIKNISSVIEDATVTKVQSCYKEQLIKDKFINGNKEVYKIKTSYGYELKATPDHKVKVINDDNEWEWKQLSEFQINDLVPIDQKEKLFGEKKETSAKLAELMGSLVGDGCISTTGKSHKYLNVSITYDIRDRDVAEEQVRTVEREFRFKPIIRDKGTFCVLYICKHKIAAMLEAQGIKRVRAWDKEIPRHIFESSKEVVAGFLRGLFDADGTVVGRTVTFYSSSLKLIKQVQLLLLQFGITSRITERAGLKRHKIGNWVGDTRVGYSLVLSAYRAERFIEEIGFLSARKNSGFKQTTLADYPKTRPYKGLSDYFLDKIVSIEKSSIEPVFDFHIKDTHEYIANGFLVHNCEPPKAKDAYFADEARVVAIVDKTLTNPWPEETGPDRLSNKFFSKGFNYYVGVDLALKHDRAGFALCHREIRLDKTQEVVIDLLKTWEAPRGGEIDFENIRKLIYQLRDRGFKIQLCLLDSFQSADFVQIMKKSQVPAENKYSTDKGKKVYDTMKDLVNQARIRCVECRYTGLLINELLGLSLITNKKIDHPAMGSKDLADAAAMAVYASSLNIIQPAFGVNW